MSTICIAAVQLWSDARRTPDENRAHALEMAREAASEKPDLIVLPEAISMLCYPDGRPDFTYHDVSEPVPGPTTDRLSEIARAYQTNIVAGLVAKRAPGNACQNTTVIMDRSGTLVDVYEKTHEPTICKDAQAASVGDELPVFDLDFGRIGIMVCWDLISPEVASILAHKGAQLICFPHLIGLPNVANFEVQIRARSIDTGLPIVCAGMRDEVSHRGDQDGMQATCIVDADGTVVAQADKAGAYIVNAEIDLAAATPNRIRVQKMRPDLRLGLYAREYAALAARRTDSR